MDDAKFPRSAIPMLVGGAIMLGLSTGLRQSLGLFVQPASRDLAIGVSEFTLAIAIQNLVWGCCSRWRAFSRCGSGFAR